MARPKRKDVFQENFANNVALLSPQEIAQIFTQSPGWDHVLATQPEQVVEVKYPSDPVEFMQKTLGYQMWPKLAEICRSVEKNHNTVVESGKGVGKCSWENDDVFLADGRIVKAKTLVGKQFNIIGFDRKDWSIGPRLAYAENNGIQECLEITLTNGVIIHRTVNHPLLTWDKWTIANELNVGDRIAIPLVLPFFGNLALDAHVVKLIAYMITEGCTVSPKAVQFTQNPGLVANEFVSIVEQMNCVTRLGKNGRGFGIYGKKVNGKYQPNYILRAMEDFSLVGKYSYMKRVPEIIFTLNQNLLALFINRMFAGDGCCFIDRSAKNPKVAMQYTTNSYGLANDMQRLLLRFGIVSRIYPKPTAEKYHDQFIVLARGPQNLIRFAELIGAPLGKEDVFLEALTIARQQAVPSQDYDVIPQSAYHDMWIERRKLPFHWKKDVRLEFPPNRKPTRHFVKRFEDIMEKTMFDGWSSSNIGWCSIKSIKSIGLQPTICISVPESQAYVTDVIDHNSVTSASLACWWITTHDPAVVITLAPTFSQVQSIIWQQIRSVGRKAKLPGDIMESPRWRLTDDRWAIGLSPRKSSDMDMATLAGRHSPNLLVIMDEASGLPRQVWDTVAGLAVSENNRVVAVGNPIEQAGPFWDACNNSRWTHQRISCFDHPNVIEGRDIIPGAVTRSYIDDGCYNWAIEVEPETPEAIYISWQDKWYKPTSPMFYSAILGIAPEQAEDQLIKLSWVIDAQNRIMVERDVETVLGFDPAPRGGDDNALCRRDGNAVRWIKRRKSQDTQALADWLQVEIRETSAVKAYIDDLGVGVGVTDRSRKLGLPIMAVNFSRSASQKKRFANLRAECYWRVRELLREGKMSLPLDNLLAADLTTPKYGADGYGRILIEAKDEIRKRIGRSPDSGDSLALTYALPMADIDEDVMASISKLAEHTENWQGSRWTVTRPRSGASRWRR